MVHEYRMQDIQMDSNGTVAGGENLLSECIRSGLYYSFNRKGWGAAGHPQVLNTRTRL